MFTVIIAEKEILDLYKEFHMFLAPFDSKDIVFCEWNREGDSLEEMLPDLYKTIDLRSEWRAVIVNQDGLRKLNPFHYTGYSESSNMGRLNWNEIKERRERRFESYQKAIHNPLTKLTSALCGAPVIGTVIQDRQMYQDVISGKIELYECMLKMKLQEMNIKTLAARLRAFQQKKLYKFVKEADIEPLIGLIEKEDVSGIIQIIGVSNVIEFIQFIGESDPYFSDPEYIECMVENTMKKDLLEQIFAGFHMKDHAPAEVICLSPRTYDMESHIKSVDWSGKDEIEYSRFAEFNLYPEILKYMVFDMFPEEHKQYAADQVRFLCLLLVLAGNASPQGVLAKERVYRVDVQFEEEAVGHFCVRYINKLKATLSEIKELELQVKQEKKQKLDDEIARQLFEADVEVPVRINSELDEEGLFAKYSQIGLSGNCPQSEAVYWAEQSHNIKKLFVRYLREPRRAVKTAVKDDFRVQNSVEDEKILLLNEYQKEDIIYRLQEEEQNMVETATTQLFNTAEYNKRIEEADEELQRAIGQRMSRKKTIIVALIAAAAYLIGFLPLIFNNLKSVKSALFSLSITGIAIGVFLVIGFIFLFILRRQLIHRFKHFNYVMSGICKEIEDGLAEFSKYLSHACNVMREFSILNFAKREENRKERILRKHQLDVVRKIEEVNSTFASYISPEIVDTEIPDPFDFDFSVMRNYNYDMNFLETYNKIVYMQPGNLISVPVDYLKSITVTREELYD